MRRLLPRSAAAIASAVSAAALLLGVAACAPAADAEDGAGAQGVSVSVYQPRPDIAAGRIAIQVHNDSDEELTVEAASLTSTFFSDDLVWEHPRDARVQPGRAVDLRVALGSADCADTAEVRHVVRLSYSLGGDEHDVELVPGDEFDVLELLHDDACLGERVAAVATLTAARLDAPAAGQPATLTVAVEPTGADGEIRIDGVTSTTLLMPAGADGVGTGELDVGIAIDADGPAEVRIPLVPNRCDPHALAEDKIGTRIPLLVTAPDGSSGRLVLAASDELRAAMYAFYSAYCGLG